MTRRQARYLYASVPQRYAFGVDAPDSGGWSAAAVRPGLEYVARQAAMSTARWSDAIRQAVAVMSAAGVRTDAVYDPATGQFYPWTEPAA